MCFLSIDEERRATIKEQWHFQILPNVKLEMLIPHGYKYDYSFFNH